MSHNSNAKVTHNLGGVRKLGCILDRIKMANYERMYKIRVNYNLETTKKTITYYPKVVLYW